METIRTYLVVVDDTPESRIALRYAALRAAHVGARVTLLHTIPAAEFMQWGGVQELIQAEATATAEALLTTIADEVTAAGGERPSIIVRQGEITTLVMETVAADPSIHALVLGAAARGAPGPLVDFFAGERAGQLPCLVMIVPGSLDAARLADLT